MPSPIEMMIDQACGITTPLPTIKFLTLRCPTCGKKTRAAQEWFDPLEAGVQLFDCPACRTADSPVSWLDKEGNEVV